MRTCFEVCDACGFASRVSSFWRAYVEGVYIFILWSEYISRLSDLVVASGFGCFREISSGFAKSNFAFMIVDFHLERELIFGRRKLVSMRKRSFLLGGNGFREIRKMLLAWRYCQK